MAFSTIGLSGHPPLTTIYTAAATCFKGGLQASDGTQAEQTAHHTDIDDYDHCLPSGMYDAAGTFSPDICPDSYTTAFKTTVGTVTIAECCPRYA
jgi:hypothetical protein